MLATLILGCTLLLFVTPSLQQQCINNPDAPGTCLGLEGAILSPGLHAGCNDDNVATTDLCLALMIFNPETNSSSPQCECVNYCTLSCDDQNSCTTDEAILLANGTCACDYKYTVSELCPAPTLPSLPVCTVSNNCVLTNLSLGMCQPFPNGTNSSFQATHSGCNDCDPGTVDLCLMCDYGNNGTYFCQCEYIEIPGYCNNDATCDDGNACTIDVCSNSTHTCQHSALDCNDGTQCTVDYCDSQYGCRNEALICNDNSLCTTDSCDAISGCQFVSISCDDSVACSIDTCDPAIGCHHTANNSFCGDTNFCVQSQCDYLNITGLTNTTGCVVFSTDCSDDIACTFDYCLPQGNGSCQHALTDLHGHYSCSDGFSCTTDICAPSDPSANSITGCIYVPNNSSCSAPYTCQYAFCDTNGDGHDLETGCIIRDTPGFCSDGASCSDDFCAPNVQLDLNVDPTTGCAHVLNSGQCDDSYSCTFDVCAPQSEFALPLTGCINVQQNSSCNDNVTCTLDVCIAQNASNVDQLSGCSFLPQNNSCTTEHECAVTFCDPVLGCVLVPDDSRCVDAFACSTDTCSLELGCQHVYHNDQCNDGFSCTTDICGPFAADIHGPHVYTNTSTGCSYLLINSVCQSNLVGCATGTCIGASYVNIPTAVPGVGYSFINSSGCLLQFFDSSCDDHINCTADVCNPVQGCLYSNPAELCPASDVCNNVICNTTAAACTSSAVDCDDLNPCTADFCTTEGNLGCYHILNESCCNTNSDCISMNPLFACLDTATCTNHTCHFTPLTCDDRLACTDDSCDFQLGCQHMPHCNPAPFDNITCALSYCNESAGGLCLPVNPTYCDDNIDCTSEFCYGIDSNTSQGYSCNIDTGCCRLTNNDLCVTPPCNNPADTTCTVDRGCIFVPYGQSEIDALCQPNACQVAHCNITVGNVETGCYFESIPNCCLSDVECDDGNECTRDTCNFESHTCNPHVATREAEQCEDNNACTIDNTCCDGVCKGRAVDCSDNDICTLDSCVALGSSTVNYVCKHSCDSVVQQRNPQCQCCEDCDCPDRAAPHCISIVLPTPAGIAFGSTEYVNTTRTCGCVPDYSIDQQRQVQSNCREGYTCVATLIAPRKKRAFASDEFEVEHDQTRISFIYNGSATPLSVIGLCAPVATPLDLDTFANIVEPMVTIDESNGVHQCDSNNPLNTCPRGTCLSAGFYTTFFASLQTYHFVVDTCLAPIHTGYPCFFQLPCTYGVCSILVATSEYVCTGSQLACDTTADCPQHAKDSERCTDGVCTTRSLPLVAPAASCAEANCYSDEICRLVGDSYQCIGCTHNGNLESYYSIGCSLDTDCPCWNQVCDASTHSCVTPASLGEPCNFSLPLPGGGDGAVVQARSCAAGLVCVSTHGSMTSFCAECETSENCGQGHFCNQEGRCEDGCSCDNECDDGNPCTSECCTNDGQCHYTCIASDACRASGCCTTSGECLGPTPIDIQTNGNYIIVQTNTSRLASCNPASHVCSAPYCGDGVVQWFEQCDQGSQNNDNHIAGQCTTSCTIYVAPTLAPTPAPTPTPVGGCLNNADCIVGPSLLCNNFLSPGVCSNNVSTSCTVGVSCPGVAQCVPLLVCNGDLTTTCATDGDCIVASAGIACISLPQVCSDPAGSCFAQQTGSCLYPCIAVQLGTCSCLGNQNCAPGYTCDTNVFQCFPVLFELIDTNTTTAEPASSSDSDAAMQSSDTSIGSTNNNDTVSSSSDSGVIAKEEEEDDDDYDDEDDTDLWWLWLILGIVVFLLLFGIAYYFARPRRYNTRQLHQQQQMPMYYGAQPGYASQYSSQQNYYPPPPQQQQPSPQFANYLHQQ